MAKKIVIRRDKAGSTPLKKKKSSGKKPVRKSADQPEVESDDDPAGKATRPKSIALEKEALESTEESTSSADPQKLLSNKVQEARKKSKKKPGTESAGDPAEPAKAKQESGEDSEAAAEEVEVFRFYCIRCGQKLKVRVSSAGKFQPCPACKNNITVPEPLPEG